MSFKAESYRKFTIVKLFILQATDGVVLLLMCALYLILCLCWNRDSCIKLL